jgi:hypothetical protein
MLLAAIEEANCCWAKGRRWLIAGPETKSTARGPGHPSAADGMCSFPSHPSPALLNVNGEEERAEGEKKQSLLLWGRRQRLSHGEEEAATAASSFSFFFAVATDWSHGARQGWLPPPTVLPSSKVSKVEVGRGRRDGMFTDLLLLLLLLLVCPCWE